MNRVRIINPGNSWLGTEYHIGNKKISNVKSVNFRCAVDEVPTFQFETTGLPDIDMHGDVIFKFHSETVVDAMQVLQHELIHNNDLRAGFIASIKSSLHEAKPYTKEHDMAVAILERLVG